MASYNLCKCGYCVDKGLRRYNVRWRDKAGKQKFTHKDTAQECKDFILQIEKDLATGRGNTDITLNEYSQEVPITRGNPTSVENSKRIWDKHIRDSIGGIKLQDLNRKDVIRWVEEDLVGYTPATKRKYLGYINRLCDYAIADRIIEVNPCKFVYIEGDHREYEPNPLTTDQLFDFIEVWDNDERLKEYSNYVTGLAFLGARPSELSAVRWKNVDLDKKEIKIRESFTTQPNGSIQLDSKLKSKRARRTLAIPEYLLGRLHFRKDKFPNNEFVFSSYEGQPIHMSNFRNRYFKQAILKVPFDISVPYDLRHTFSAIMYSTNIDIWELSSMLGHENPSTTIKWYGSWFDKANHSAVDILDDWADKGITKFKSS